MQTLTAQIDDELNKRLEDYREKMQSENNLYRPPTRSAVVCQALLDFLDRQEQGGDASRK